MTLASGDYGTTSVKLWDVASGNELATLNGSGPVAFSPDGKTLASASGEWDTPIFKLWDVATGKEQATLNRHTE